MGVFLRFGEERRLQEVIQVSSGNFGALEPEKVFPNREPGDECLELHPAVLEKMRPSALQQLRGHCVLVREGLKLDPIGTIRARLTNTARRSLELELVRKARTLDSLIGAGKCLGNEWFPAVGDELIGKAERDVESVKTQIVTLLDQPLSAEGALADLAGKTIPI